MSIFYYVNESDRSSDVEHATLRIKNQIQQRTDDCRFKVFQGTKPSENQEIEIFDGALVASHVTDTIVLQNTYQTNVQAFRAGQTIFLKIGDSSVEKAIVDTYTESTRTIVLTATPAVSLSSGDQVGELIFGGIVARVQDKNIGILENIEYIVTGVDYAKIFDKKDISDTWENVDARYIINDFVNTAVNLQSTLDNMSYENATAIRAEWIESSDGDNPNVDTSDFLEATSAGVFPWTNSGGTALWSATPTSKDLSEFFGVSSGQPTKGFVMSWFKTANQANITSIKIRIGSDSSNYASFTVTLTDSTDFQYIKVRGVDAVITGTPDWTATDYTALEIVQTGNGTISWNGLRVNAENSFTLFNVQSTPPFDDFRSPHTKPMALLNSLAQTFQNVGYIDYERDIHFVDEENDPSPFEITDTSDNFTNLQIEADVSNLGNRIKIFGGEKISDSIYSQVFEGDDALREWLMKNKFSGMAVTIDNNSSTDTMEATTTTTTVKATAHNLSVGDHITNRSQGNAVRQILTVPDVDTFTVEVVTGQGSGDTFSLFSVAKTVGVEGLTDETTVDYVSNSNEKSMRATESEAVLLSAQFIRFAYNERIPIQLQYTDAASATALKSLGLGDGIFDLDNVVDRNIKDTTTALAIAQAKVTQYGNALILGTLKTDQKGLSAGQLLHIDESTSRTVDDTYVIQQITATLTSGEFKDYFIYSVKFGTTLFGWIEFMQKLLRAKEGLEQNVDDIIETFVTSSETVEINDTNQAVLGGIKPILEAEAVDVSDVNTVVNTTVPWKWEANGVGQTLNTRWNLFEWGEAETLLDTEGFESGFGGWSTSGGDFLWTRDSGGTVSVGTGPSSGSTGSTWYIYTESSTPNHPIKEAFVEYTVSDPVRVEFDYHMYADTEVTPGTFMGTLELQEWNGSTWNTLWSQVGDQGNVWNEDESVDGFTVSGITKIRFKMTTGTSSSTGWKSDAALDNLRIYT